MDHLYHGELLVITRPGSLSIQQLGFSVESIAILYPLQLMLYPHYYIGIYYNQRVISQKNLPMAMLVSD